MTGRHQLARLLPLVLLLVLAIGGLRGETAVPGWGGPLKAHGMVIGLSLEAVLIAALVATGVRHHAARRETDSRPERPGGGPDVPATLRLVLTWVLTAGVLAVGAVLLFSLGLHTFASRPARAVPPGELGLPRKKMPRPPQPSAPVHFPVEATLYGLLIAALVIAVAASVWWSSRLRRPAAHPVADGPPADPRDLRDAVESGRAALAELDDARAAIIACYVAMERSLADRGTARNAADTPDELLARAVASGIAAGPAAQALTGLFYEARFSSHPLGHDKRDAARLALDDLAAELTSLTAGAADVEPAS